MFLSLMRHIASILISLILLIIGCFGVSICMKIGGILLLLNLITAVINAFRMQRLVNFRSEEDEEFNTMMDMLSEDPKSLIKSSMEDYEVKKQLHGAALLTLTDEELLEIVLDQNLDIADAFSLSDEDATTELEAFAGARKVLYILTRYEEEVQNGGLCQFFVNSSGSVAPYVADALKTIGAKEHAALYESFITKNHIDVSQLDSFKVRTHRGYIKQTKRYDYDAFDDAFYEMPSIQEFLIPYVKTHIEEF